LAADVAIARRVSFCSQNDGQSGWGVEVRGGREREESMMGLEREREKEREAR
jgi:hypothetical protein